MRLHRTLSPIVFTLFLLVWPTLAHADFQAGLDAYDQGDYATALKEWRPLADQGDAVAQNNLGVMYDQGQGVPQDYTQAADWYRKAAAQGYDLAQDRLDNLYEQGQDGATSWEKFIFEFCKVGFLCWQGEPNWFGWIVIGISPVVILFVIAFFIEGVRRG